MIKRKYEFGVLHKPLDSTARGNKYTWIIATVIATLMYLGKFNPYNKAANFILVE